MSGPQGRCYRRDSAELWRRDLFGRVEDPAALFAAHDLFAVLDPVGSLSRDLHVATGADLMLEGDHCGVAFACEEALEQAEQVLLYFGSNLRPLCRKLV